MKSKPEIRLGSTNISLEDSRYFRFTDAHEPIRHIRIEDADVSDLIVFLHAHSKRANKRVYVEPVNRSSHD